MIEHVNTKKSNASSLADCIVVSVFELNNSDEEPIASLPARENSDSFVSNNLETVENDNITMKSLSDDPMEWDINDTTIDVLCVSIHF